MKQVFLVFIFLFLSINLHSQKSAPVAGDAATLIDLLFKNYNTENPETTLENITHDQNKVIAIFQTYISRDASTLAFNDSNNKSILDLRSNYLHSLELFNNQSKRTDLKKSEIGKMMGLKDTLTTNKEKYFKGLIYYNSKILNELHVNCNENEYLRTIIKKFIDKYGSLRDNKSDLLIINNSALSIKKGIPFAGGDILVDGIDGLSRFLAKRIKEELTLNAIQNIQNYLEDKDKYPYLYELEVLLPTTFDYLVSFDADQLLKFSDDLKQYIEEDLTHLLENAIDLKNTPRIAALISKNPDLEFIFEGLEILDQVTKIKSPIDYFEIVSNSRILIRWRDEATDSSKQRIAESLQFASMLAYSLTLIENGEVKFVTTDFIATYGSRLEFCYLYFGFLHQQNERYFKIKFKRDKLITDFVADTTRINEYQKFIEYQIVPVVKNAERLHAQFVDIRKKNKNGEKVEYASIHQLIEDLLSFSEEIVVSGEWLLKEVDLDNTFELSEKLNPYFSTAQLANDITLDLHEKRYTNAITKALEISLNYTGDDSKWGTLLNQSKITTQSIDDFQSLRTILTIDLQADEEKKMQVWNDNRYRLEILSLKFSNQDNLKQVYQEINSFIKSMSAGKWNDNNYKRSRDGLMKSLNLNKTSLMTYLGVNYGVINDKLHEIMDKKELNNDAKNFIIKKYDSYYSHLFKKIVLNENSDKNYEIELMEAVKAFTPELIQDKSIKSNTQLIKFIHFVNDVAVAEDAEAYEQAIEAFVLPVGSSSLKEKAKNYYALNAFPGLLGGYEISDYIDNAGFIGFTAPVGLYIQPWGGNEQWINSIGLFLPIIDIAAPVRLRLDSDSDVETLPDFQFKDIFSPGIYLVFGFRNSPFAINVGAQYGPKLRDIPTDDPSVFTSVDSYRIGLGLTIDIPLVTLSSKYKN